MAQTRRRHVAVLLSLVVSSAACGQTPAVPSAQSTDQNSDGVSAIEGEWWLVDGHGSKGRVRISRPSEATMIIEGSKIEGTAVCNSYSGSVRIEDSFFHTRGFSVTEMGCSPPWKGWSEHVFLTALTEVDEILRRGTRLILTGPSAELRFRFHPQPPPPTLEGTRWTLNGLVHGRGMSGMVSSNDPAWLLLRKDGTLVGSTGCRRFRATWQESGDQVLVESFHTTGSCSGDASQDRHVVTVLSGGFSFEIRQQSLDLYPLEDDIGLTYTTGLR